MKKVVNGQVYDTNMAASVVSWKEESHVAGVKVTADITLNRKYVLKDGVAPEGAMKVSSWGGVSADHEKIDKAKGEFFLSFETGSWNEESRRIVPVSEEQAKEIVEKRCSFDDYVSLFGDPRGIVVSPDAVKKAVGEQRSRDYDEKLQVEKDRDAAKARVSELEDRIRELENR
jgi:hypothetical protein